MGQKLDSGIPPDRSSMRPREARTVLDAEVSLRRSGQHGYRVTVHDVSPHGCRIEFVERPSLDERVWVKFEGMDSVEGLVCWIDGFVGGVEFVSPIHQAVFDQLVGSLR